MQPKKIRNWELLVSATIIVLTFVLMIAYFNGWFSFAARVGPFRIIHYVAFAGTLYVAIGVVLFSYFKRRKPNSYKSLVHIHAFGNLIAFLLISLHFAGQLGRPANFYPALGTGVALYLTMISLVGTGLFLKFGVFRKLKPETSRFVHSALAFAFYIVILIHILHGLNII